MTTVAIITLGCKLNQYESMGIRESLEDMGFKVIEPESGADLYIVNTCTVTSKTDRRSRHAVRRIANWNPSAKIIVTGCSSQRDPTDFENIPNVALVTGNREKNRFQELVHDALASNGSKLILKPMADAPFENIKISRFGNYTRAFIKIQDGCSHRCSYCIIPSVRGPARSQLPEKVREEVKRIVDSNFKEIVLTGIDLGAYGSDFKPQVTLTELLDSLLKIPGLRRIRLSSIEPTPLLRDIIHYIHYEPRICRHLHIPLQSGCNSILQKMHRSYQIEEYSDIIREIKELEPEMCVGADVITAFPGESIEEFDQTCNFVETSRMDYLHIFTFSPREGTEAAALPNRIEPAEAKRRCHALRTLGKSHAIRFRKQFIGKNLDCLILGARDPDTHLPIGLSDNYIKVLIKGEGAIVNEIVAIKILETQGLVSFGIIAGI